MTDSTAANDWLDSINWDADGLVPAIAQDVHTQRILMMAWMNREALQLTVQEGRGIYWSRSRPIDRVLPCLMRVLKGHETVTLAPQYGHSCQ